MDYYAKTSEETLSLFDVTENGLSETEVDERLREYGPNQLNVRGEPWWQIAIYPFRNVLMLVLFAAAAISLWHHEQVDAIIIGVIILANALIYYVQRFSTDRILRSLKQRDPEKVEVIRDGAPQHIDAAQLVPGDIIVLDEGERVPADARLLTAHSLRVDESQLTGESLPIEKQVAPVEGKKEVYEQSPMVFQGSFVVGGHATAVVIATSNSTEFGKLAVLATAPSEESPVQKKIDALISTIIRIVGAVAVIAFALALWRGMPFAESIRYVLALSVSAVPESLPVAISVVLVLGMRRMAAKKALVRTMRSIETVGILTTIATDKTGTLTKNKLTVQDVWSPSTDRQQLPQAVARALIMSTTKVHDPLDIALHEYLKLSPSQIAAAEPQAYPFDQSVAMSGNYSDGTLWLKGAPERVLALCQITREVRLAAEHQLHHFAGSGSRVIAFAHVKLGEPPKQLGDIETRSPQLLFDGIVAVADVLRPEAKRAISAATRAGIRVCMVTGDHFETAFHIGQQLGMVEHRNQVFDCRQLNGMSDEELERTIDSVRIFSRVIPEHKHRILTILKKKHITAMTGDGVNDVPALTNAHVGLAMGSGATIAKDAGDIILLDDNFRSIIDAVHEGRTIYANIKRMVAYLLSTNAGEVLVALVSLIMGIPVPLAAVQILWVNLVTDTAMVIPLGLEPGERHNMNRPPAKPDAPLFSRFMISRIVLVSITMATLTILLYKSELSDSGTAYARAVAFHALIVMQWANAFNYRSDYESIVRRIRRFSGAFFLGLGVAVGLQLLALFGPLGDFLHIVPLQTKDLLVTTALAFILPIFVVEIHKWIGRHYFNKGHVARPKHGAH
jgi:Ca2+-transporting ATPase